MEVFHSHQYESLIYWAPSLGAVFIACCLIICINASWRVVKPRQEINLRREPIKRSDCELDMVLFDLQDADLTIRAGRAGTKTLKNLWRLNNPFVSDSQALQREYRTSLLRSFNGQTTDSWTSVARTVSVAIEPLISRHESGLKYNVRAVSRCGALAAMFKSLFDIDDIGTERLEYIGGEIHRLTVAKKHFDAGNPKATLFPQELQIAADRLIENLRELFEDAKNTSPLANHILCGVSGNSVEFNPLDLVIPAFEAPWRAVYYTLLALLQVNTSERLKDIELLRQCYDVSNAPARAMAVCYESLRLYPPIRRVRRKASVDIESVQRNPSYWGADAIEWNPGRFLGADGKEIQKERLRASSAWMPFAVGSMTCPSSGGYSVHLMIAAVSEILRQTLPSASEISSASWNLEGPEWLEDDKKGHVLRAGRDEYASVQMSLSIWPSEQMTSHR